MVCVEQIQNRCENSREFAHVNGSIVLEFVIMVMIGRLQKTPL